MKGEAKARAGVRVRKDAQLRTNGGPQEITVLIADPQRLVAESLAGALAADPCFQVLEEMPATGLDTVEAITDLAPKVSIVDYWMPEIEGPAIVRLARVRHPERSIVLLAWFEGPTEKDASMRAGAAGFLSKSASLEELRRLVAAAATMDLPPPNISMFDPDSEIWERLGRLSRRQIEIIGLMSMDLSAPTVAQNLKISPQTVKVHMRNILAKTGLNSKKDVVAMARKVGIIRN